jgi:hypothetical protein
MSQSSVNDKFALCLPLLLLCINVVIMYQLALHIEALAWTLAGGIHALYSAVWR